MIQNSRSTRSLETIASESIAGANVPPAACSVSVSGHSLSFTGRNRCLNLLRRIFSIDLRTLAALRIGTGLLLLIDLYQRAGDLTAHYSDSGLMPRAVVIDKILESPWCISVHLMSGATAVEALLFAVAAVLAGCLLVGFHTRLCSVGSWFLLLSLHYRNPMVLQGGDVLLRMLLFWGMFLPLGAKLSVDSLLQPAKPTSRAMSFFSIATVAMLLQLAFMYWFSVLLKKDPVWFRDYTAVFCALSLEHFVTPLGKLLLPYHTLLNALTFGTLWLEGLGPVLALLSGLFRWPIRVTLILMFAAFHLTMGLCLELGLFSIICCVAWLAYLPGGFWDSLQRLKHYRSLTARIRVLNEHLSAKLTRQFRSYPNRGTIQAPFNYTSFLTQIIAAFFLLYVLLWNLRTINPQRYTRLLPHSADWIGFVSGVAQCWDMFAPAPLKEGGWFVMPAQLQDGSEVDLWRNGAPVNWEKPELISAMYKNDRWRKYMVVLAAAVNTDRRLYFARYLCNRWNQSHPRAKQILSMQMYLMEEDVLSDYRLSTPRPVLLWTQSSSN